MSYNAKKITVWQDQLEDVYQQAAAIVALSMNDDPAFALGQAQGMAASIQTVIQQATHGTVGGENGGKGHDSTAGE